MRFVDERVGFAVGERNTETVDRYEVLPAGIVASRHPDPMAVIMKTTDGGLTWHQRWCLRADTSLNAVSLVDGGLGWAVGDYGTVLATKDGGHTWRATGGLGSDLHDVHFFDSDTGFAVAGGFDKQFTSDAALADFTGDDLDIDPANLGVLIRTDDGGDSWSPVVAMPSTALRAMAFPDRMHGWVVGAKGTVLATTDGGLTWFAQESGTLEDLHAVAFHDHRHGWAAGACGTALYTEDGGERWTHHPVVGGTLLSLHCVGAGKAWATGTAGVYALGAHADFEEEISESDVGPNPLTPGTPGQIAVVALADSGVVRIREMQRHDLSTIRRFFALSGLYEEMPRLPFPFMDGWARTLDIDESLLKTLSVGSYGLIAEEEDEIVGYLALEMAPEHHRRELVRLSVGVAPDARRRGVASALMHHALDLVDSWLPVTRVECMLYSRNDAGLALLHKHGFQSDMALRGYTFQGQGITDVTSMSRMG